MDIYTRCHEPPHPTIVPLSPGVRVVHLPAGPPEEEDKESLFSYLPEFCRHLLSFPQGRGYQLLHSHYWLSAWAGARLKGEWGLPHIVTFHTLGEVKRRAHPRERETKLRLLVEREVMAQADRILACSPAEKASLENYYHIPPQKIQVIPCGVDLELFYPRNKALARGLLGIAEPRVVLFVGRMDPLKGVEVFILAGAYLDRRTRFLIAGGDEESRKEMERLQGLTRSLGMEHQVTFLGKVPHHLLPLYYSAADVCVIPSYHESFGLVALEAQACGTPVVAARRGGLESTVKDGETGFLLPHHCPEAFAERLELLLHNPSLCQTYSQAAIKIARPFAWPAIAPRILDFYRSLTVEGKDETSVLEPLPKRGVV